MVIDGAQLFVRYAYPPNSRGSCGPPDSDALLHYGQSGVTDQGLRELARGFAGAWPYLELIAGSHGIPDPLDARVVEAYWVGNSLLDSVGITNIGNSMEDRFRARTGRQFPHLVEGVLAGGVPHHSFHVFEIYPWLGLLRDERRHATALNVLDRCRIRWGAGAGDHRRRGRGAVPAPGVGRHVAGGRRTRGGVRQVRRQRSGFRGGLAVGDVVSLHWDWVCDRLTPQQLQQLKHFTARHLRIANSGVEHRGAPSRSN